MSFYDDASLVVIPSAQKTSKLYAVKPTDGSGDLAFTRTGDTATRVNSAGLIEKVRTNLATYSEDFANAAWGKTDITVTANTTANPVDGATTADTLTRTGAIVGFINRQIAQTGIVTFSVFAKAGTTDLVRLNTYDGAVDRGATYNLTTGAITGAYGSPLFTTAQSFGNGWYRISVSVNAATYTRCQIHLDTINSVIVFGAMLETSDIATPYIPTLTAAVSTGPTANVPRLDYLGSTCGKLLLEPQRTNLVTYSEQLDNAVWDNNAGGVLVTANNTIAPDGTQSADKIEDNPASARAPWMLQFFSSLSGGQNYVYSIYAKAATAGTKQLAIWNNSTNWSYQNISVTTEWKRFEFPFVANASATQWGVGMEFNTGETEYFVWGAQLELGAYATSYIPTLAASATRGADACSKTGISSLIGQTEGTVFAELTFQSSCIPIFIGSSVSGSAGEATYVEFDGSSVVAWVYKGGVLQASLSASGFTNGQNFKLAVAYKQNNFALYINGTQRATDTSGDVSTSLTNLTLHTYPLIASTFQYNGKFSQFLLFKTRLTNAALAELTTL